ncbi:RNA-binding protein CP31B, chloroplastic-like [Trifolium pratense]|uniref:RNA-binding protein CP31B, chloroplastic-like n=1 Tax=Trifolium pratense TaxID=57577 RepID=UPI001E697568|nr:RNA-binding protein CP31B, chloroplastic-like [Trifolium pratense]
MLFEEVGIVNGASLNVGNVDGKSFASVTMSTVQEVEKAIKKFNGYVLNGKLLTVSREKPEPRRAYNAHFLISVSNLPKDVDSGRLEEIFSKYGSVYDVQTDYNEQLDESTGSLTMTNEYQMINAIAALDGQSLDGKVIRLFVETLEIKSKMFE